MQSNHARLGEHLFIHHGSCNVGILRNGDRALLIDCGDGHVSETLRRLGVAYIDQIVFTHHHRDSASGIGALATNATKVGAPAGERTWFEAVETFWNDPQYRWHLYNLHPHNLMLAESVAVHETYQDGESFRWGGAQITVLETPGHTDGSVSYLVAVDGQRFAFCGDTIYDVGQIWELYSLQKGETTTDYHGFLGDRKRLLASLEKILAHKPDVLIPTHGNIMAAPRLAVDALAARLDECYDRYVAISALRFYFPAMFETYTERPGHMLIRPGLPVPPFLRHYGTTWVIIADNGEAFVMDCGSQTVIDALRQLQAEGEITEVTACWVTHYHDDHVDAMPQFQEAFPCFTVADRVVAHVIEQPQAFRLPCISPAVVRLDRRTQDGETWTWNEFRVTAYHFPGQTYYHGGLLVEGHGLRLFFSGDSFTPAGIDDYCAGNRNLLGAGVGYDRCLALLAELKPTHIFNCHVNEAFAFTAEEIYWMRQNLAGREQLYGELFPWDHPNFGMDEHWVRCEPYEQVVRPGETVKLAVVITNHSDSARIVQAQPILPRAWQTDMSAQSVTAPPQSEVKIQFTFAVPLSKSPTECVVIPIALVYDGDALGQWREAILNLQ
jgi:glyoxylase-like metal-dependent hydrolase (beta-lactamase superfamily II)